MYIDASFDTIDLTNHLTDICTTIYLPKCSLRCPYCFNLDVVDNKNLKRYTKEEFESEVAKSKDRHFVLTGGEALFNFPNLKYIVNTIKKYSSKPMQINTNMMHPFELYWFLENVDNPIIAFDLKTSLSRYGELNPIFTNFEGRFKVSLLIIKDFLKNKNKLKKVQCRTTLSDFVPKEILLEMPKLICDLSCNDFSWSLQDLEPKKIYTKAEVNSLIDEITKKYDINILHNGE